MSTTISSFDFEQFDILAERIEAIANLLMLIDGVDGVTYSEDIMGSLRDESYTVINGSASKIRELYKELKDDIVQSEAGENTNLKATTEEFLEAYDRLCEEHGKVCLELAKLKAGEAIST